MSLMTLKKAWAVTPEDAPRIEDPFFAKSIVERAYYHRYGGDQVLGIDEALRDTFGSSLSVKRDARGLTRLLGELQAGNLVLVHGAGSQPFSPVIWTNNGFTDPGNLSLPDGGGSGGGGGSVGGDGAAGGSGSTSSPAASPAAGSPSPALPAAAAVAGFGALAAVPNGGQQVSPFQRRQAMVAAASRSADPAIQQAAQDLARLNHDVEHAKLSQHVYDDPAVTPPPDGWAIATPAQLAMLGLLPSELESPGSEFRARVYMPDPNVLGSDMKPTISMKGTTMTSLQDWKNNLQQGLGIKSEYYKSAVQIGKNTMYAKADVEFTGHSLGGGLASAASQASGADATTFNSAGLNKGTVLKYGGTPQATDINAYRIDGEILTGIQEQSWKSTRAVAAAGFAIAGPKGALIGAGGKAALSAATPDAIGTKYDLEGSGNPVARHGMNQNLDALDAQIKAKEQELVNAGF